jgi:uracil-DNA glycosylase
MKLNWDEIDFLTTGISKNTYSSYQFGDYKMLYINYVPNYTFTNEEASILVLLDRIHYSWFNPLKTYLLEEYVKKTVPYLFELRKKVNVYPQKEDVLNAFKIDINLIRVVIIGQDPYPAGNHANGYAFGTKQDVKPGSLQMIEKAIKKDYPECKDLEIDKTLVSWKQAGVMLLNSSLTVEENKPNSHEHLWKDLISFVIKLLNARPKKVVFVFIGKNAQEYSKLVTKENHKVFSIEHPAAALYNKREWNDNNIFKNINNELDIKIKWI